MFKRLFSDPSKLMDLKRGTVKGLALSPPPQVDRPTYEICGQIERYDGRDQVYNRQLLRPGGDEYEDYYSRHPEIKEQDDARRQRAVATGTRLLNEDALNHYLALCGFYGAIALSRPEVVSAKIKMPISPIDMMGTDRIETDAEEMTRKIKALGLQLGAAKVGIAELNQNWVYSHYPRPQYGQTVELTYQYVICLAFLQDPFMLASGAGPAVDLEIGFRYGYASFVSTMIANFIRRLGWPARPLPTFNAPYLVCPVFIDAGIGEDGRCGYVVAKEFGNNFRPAAVATDLPLIPDRPVDFGLQDFCQQCRICAEACPSNAITEGDREMVRGVRKWQMDAERCYNYWVARGSTCAICQIVCPWNHANGLFHNVTREIVQRFPSLRSFLIKGEKLLYGRRRFVAPEWMAGKSSP